MIGYKVLAEDGSPCNGGSGKWHLPSGKCPGKWMPEIAYIRPCRRGYHFCRHERDLIHWLGPVIWRVEVRGDIIEDDDKAVASEARLVSPTLWNDQTARLFAADCAEQVLHQIPNKTHREVCVRAIATARGFARGTETSESLAAAWDAARAAAWAAAGAAARAAAWDAAWEWQAARLAQYLNAEAT